MVNERSTRKIFDQRGAVRMIYITGDCHADFTRFNTKIFPEQYEMTKDADNRRNKLPYSGKRHAFKAAALPLR